MLGDPMTALTALASATIVAPDEAAIPAALEATVRRACAGAWRAVEVVLAGDVLRGRLGKTRDTYVRDAVEAVLGLFGSCAVRPEALAELRAARRDGVLDGALELAAITTRARTEGAASIHKHAITAVHRAVADHRALAAALAEPELAALLVDAARALFRSFARDPALARWAIGPTGIAGRDRGLVAFAELIDSQASVDELDTLIALPIHLDDNVQFTVYRPRTIDPGRWHPLLAFAHLADRRLDDAATPDPVEEVKRQAEAVLGDRAAGYQSVTQDSGAAIPAEGELVFVPELPGIEINPPRRSFLWLEDIHREEFRMRAGAALDGKTVRGRLTVFLGHIAIAEVPLAVRVDRKQPDAVREPARARAYRKIFASYSHRDIAIVNQFETYARALGDEYLRDWIHLRTGEVWNDRLRQLIEQADAFQLFWSWSSMQSKFVRQEYEHALALNRPSFVRPTYWEEPMPTAPGLPPEALLRLHFQKLGGIVLPQANAALARLDAEPTDTARELAIPEASSSESSLPTAPDAIELEYAPTNPSVSAVKREDALTSRARAAPRPQAPPPKLDDDLDDVIDPPAPPAARPRPSALPPPAPPAPAPMFDSAKQKKKAAEMPVAEPYVPSTLQNAAPPAPRQAVAKTASPSKAFGAPERPSSTLGPRVICDRCGFENAPQTRFCKSCGITLAPSLPPTAAQPERPNAPAELLETEPSEVSPYAPTVPQQAYKNADPFGATNKMAAKANAPSRRPEVAESRRSSAWIFVVLAIVVIAVAVFVYLLLR